MKSKSLVLLAGTALSLGAATTALAQNADETRAVVAQAMADAETRTSLLSGGDAGHDGKFFIAGDGFRLNVGGQIQFRYIADLRDEDAPVDDFSNGFQTRRTKLNFNGTVNKDWYFKVLGSFDRSEGGFGLEEAYAGYKFANGWSVQWGQFKLPLLREELVSSSMQLAVERSITNDAFTQDRSQGIQFAYEQEAWRLMLAFSDGLDSENTDFNGPGNTANPPAFVTAGEAEYAFTGRFEYMFSGNWKQWNDFTAEKGGEFGALLGVAAHYQKSTQTPNPADVDVETFQATADISFEGDSWNLFAAGIYRFQDFSALGGGDNDLSDFGFVVHGGYRFAENTEIFARFDGIFADEDRFPAGEDSFSFITFGVNQYYAGHAAKASLDVVIALEDTSNLSGLGTGPNTGQGILGDMEEGEFAIRAQFQLLF